MGAGAVRADERARLAREMHDVVSHEVTLIAMQANSLSVASSTQAVTETAETIRSLSSRTLDQMRSLVGMLRSPEHESELASLDQIGDLIRDVDLPVRLRVEAAPDTVPAQVSAAAFRTVQEALTNVRKHAGAREATVTLMSDGSGQLKVVIADDGQGFTPGSQKNKKARPLGLTSMRERVEALGGTFEVKSQSGSGTQVTATIPIRQARQEGGHATPATPAG
jgi:signal transduction histidine kinase